ncbi:guanyl-nucleotide exchange factor [Niveomyces insectorum RCEF 264]|uniref:Guanyl-nucleotide exchange factor n=1 Tax=Niveomyces insectorum RCEF 264 TaxID=1081102 RepID=A0A167X5H6_9HYPO|nr:guanyl-nucleotide exchange factor [Niveomyces insectorum RCEF 264]
MPFLRRRGVMASESDMRRHTSFFHPLSAAKAPQLPQLSLRHQQPDEQDEEQPRPPVSTQSETAVAQPFESASEATTPVPATTTSNGLLNNDTTASSGASAVSEVARKQDFPSSDANTIAASAIPAVLPATPPSEGGSDGNAACGVASPDSRFQRTPESPLVQEETSKHRRFSLLRFRNASDSQLSTRARQHALAQAEAEDIPPVPHPPEIIMTAPTFELRNGPQKKQSRAKLGGLVRKSSDIPRRVIEEEPAGGRTSGAFGSWSKRDRRKSLAAHSKADGKMPVVAFDESTIHHHDNGHPPPPPPPSYGDDANTTLALPVTRLSESSRSDGSSGDRVYGSTTTTTHTVHTTTTFFRLSRRRKNSNPPSLFPISHLPQKTQPIAPENPAPATDTTLRITTPPDSHSSGAGVLSPRSSTRGGNDGADEQETPTRSRPVSQSRGSILSSSGPGPSPALALFHKGNPSPATAFFRPSSRNSGHSSPTRSIPGAASATAAFNRGRSSTLSSLGRESADDHLTLPTLGSSASATGRKSFSDLLGLSRLRQESDPTNSRHNTLTPATPRSITSKNNSLQLPRDAIILPERRDDDTPAKYLARLEEVVSRSVIASALSKSTDPFSQAVLRSYMRSFKFFGDPMDMAIRKLLMEAELPRETQQIDRFLQAFANRYHECNPGIFSSPDQAYFIAFSLLILHTDVFNKNNKHKMQKQDYQKNTRGEGIFDEILEVFYDNIAYTPFIHVEDDLDINGERIIAHKAKRKSIFPNASPDLAKRSTKEPIDPYTLIIDDKLDVLRPNLKDIMQLEDPYSYLGSAKSLNMKELQQTFFRTGVLQIVSARSRPDAFMSERTATNPQEAHPGIVDIKITKVGLLWRKDAKKKKTRSPWQEWGAILTGAQLYFFRNTPWVKSLMHQYETHIRHGQEGIPIIFKPPLEEFKPDALMSTDGAIALLDSSYKKHKHAFTYVRHGGHEEVLLADNEEEMNDWLAKLNYAAAFRSSGVRMRGVVGGIYDGQDRRAVRHMSSEENQSVQTPSGEVTITRSRIDQKMAQDILAARRDIMYQKVADANEKLEIEEKKLEVQLRNSRHLQIMAPIQPKTREQMLLSAARMDAQLKRTRMEIWRLKCHRDILEMDLEEERLLCLGPEHALESGAAFAGMIAAASAAAGVTVGGRSSSSVDRQAQPPLQLQQPSSLHREQSKASAASTVVLPRSPRSGTHRSSLASGSISSGSAVTQPQAPADSPLSDIFQTPPTTATAAAFFENKPQNPSDATPSGIDDANLRKASVSSVVSSGGRSITATPPRAVRTPASAQEKALQHQQQHQHQHQHQHAVASGATALMDEAAQEAHGPRGRADSHDVDADERQLLQTTGLLESALPHATSGAKFAGFDESVLAGDANQLQQHQQLSLQDAPQTPQQHDKNKIRRTFQRTLREGAGHLSHRGRRTKDGSSAAVPDDANGEQPPSILERGTGSFVVHGKKASVVNFGADLQAIIPPEGRLRQRKQQQQQQLPQQSTSTTSHDETNLLMPSTSGGSGSSGGGGGDNTAAAGYGDAGALGFNSDYRAAIFQHQRDHERHGSTASASTATARSFRELHRKYSSVRATSRSSAGGKGSLRSNDDDESEAGVSNSEGRHTPLSSSLAADEAAAAAAAEKERKRIKYLSGVGEASGGEDEQHEPETGGGGGGGGGEHEHEHEQADTERGTAGSGREDADEAGQKTDAARNSTSLPASVGEEAPFFTPDPPATPRPRTPSAAATPADADHGAHGGHSDHVDHGDSRLTTTALQAVHV